MATVSGLVAGTAAAGAGPVIGAAGAMESGAAVVGAAGAGSGIIGAVETGAC
jgi:hypothetical protein